MALDATGSPPTAAHGARLRGRLQQIVATCGIVAATLPATALGAVAFGNLSWTIPDPQSVNTVRFNFVGVFSKAQYTCINEADHNACPAGTAVVKGGLVRVGSLSLDYGDGTSASPAPSTFFVDSIDAAGTIAATLASSDAAEVGLTHPYTVRSTPYSARLSAGRRIDKLAALDHVNNSTGQFTITNQVTLVVNGNKPPAFSITPALATGAFTCPRGTECQIPLDIRDPDAGDSITVQPVPVAGVSQPVVTIAANKTLVWSSAKEDKLGLYSVQLFASDNHGNATATDFLITLADDPPLAPIFDTGGACQDIAGRRFVAGKTAVFNLMAHDQNTGATVTLALATLPGATVRSDSVLKGANPVLTVAWKPTEARKYQLSATATDNTGLTTTCEAQLTVSGCEASDCLDPGSCRSESCNPTTLLCEPMKDSPTQCAPDPDGCGHYVCEPNECSKNPTSCLPSGCRLHEASTPQCCSDCTDNDHDGDVDAEDADCCALSTTKIKLRQRHGKHRKRLIVHMGVDRGLAENVPPSQIVLPSSVADQSICCSLDPSHWEPYGRGRRCMKLIKGTQPSDSCALAEARLCRPRGFAPLRFRAVFNNVESPARDSAAIRAPANAPCVPPQKPSS